MARCSSAITFATSLLFVLFLGLPLKAAYAQTDPQSCLSAGCHENQNGILHTKHAVKSDGRTPFGSGKACAACHGDNPNHLKDPKANPQPNRFGKAFPAEPQNAVCMTCHKGGHLLQWTGSAHERTQASCTSCHSAHAPKDQVLVPQTQAGVCYTCHKDVRAQTFAQSAHPIRQGIMSCSSCHAPHGSLSERFSLVKSSVNDTCFTCHAAKRGPFLWPHPPVVEDCGNCHNPHGSNNAPMLNARGPYLCQQCHVIGQHPAVLRSGAALPPINAGNAAQSAYVVGQNCANCHTKVHGSNHPSGNTFTR